MRKGVRLRFLTLFIVVRRSSELEVIPSLLRRAVAITLYGGVITLLYFPLLQQYNQYLTASQSISSVRCRVL